MHVCVVGVNHQTTPVAIRGKLAITTGQLQDALLSLHNHISQGIILCTCSRTEVYALAEESALAESAIINFLKTQANLSPEDLRRYAYTHYDEAAVRHIFRVAAGLDSMIIGEYEVLGQVRRALEEAEKSCLVKRPLLNLFRQAVRTGRRVRAETDISKNALSVSSVAVDLAVRAVDDIRKSKILVIGAGEAGKLVAKASRQRGASQIVVVSRSKENGIALSEMLHGKWVPMEDLKDQLINCDIAISCSGAPQAVLELETVQSVMSSRPEHPLLIIDIAVPPDVESEVKQLDNVFLYDIDDLIKICDSNHNQRHDEVKSAMVIVDDEVGRFMSDWQELEVRPVIRALSKKAENIRRSQLRSTLKKLPELSDEELAHLEAMTKSIVNKLLHEPIQRLKSDPGNREKHIQTISEFFRLDEKKLK